MKREKWSLSVLGLVLLFCLTEVDGYVAVREAESGRICCVTQMPLELLPPQDAALIRAGYLCEDEAALTRALENFCS